MLRRRFGQLGLGMGMGGGISGAVGYIINLLIAACTRATERTVWGLPGDGVVADGESLLTVPINVPAITGGRLDGSTWYATDADGAPLDTSLSVYDDGENLLLQSNGFNISPWAKVYTGDGNITITPNAKIGPDGELSGSMVVFDAKTSGTANIRQVVTGLSNPSTLAPTLYAYSDTTTTLGLRQGNGGLGLESLNLPAGIWTRLQSSVGSNAAGFFNFDIEQDSDTAKTVYLYGGDLELDLATAYIPTTTTTGTRDADINTVPTPSNLTPESGAIEMVFTPKATVENFDYVWAFFSDTNNFTGVYQNAGSFFIISNTASNIELKSFILAAAVDTEYRLQSYWDEVTSKLGIRIAEASADITVVAFQTVALTNTVVVAANMSIANRGGSFILVGEYANQGQPITWASASDAGWL